MDTIALLELIKNAHDQNNLNEVLSLLNEVKNTLKPEEAISWYEQALNIALRANNKLLAATILNKLGLTYLDLEKSEQAMLSFEKALTIAIEIGDFRTQVDNLNDLAELFYAQGQYVQAESLLQRALKIRERMLASDDPNTATGLSNLGGLYLAQGKYEQAEPLLQRALAIREQRLGSNDPDTATSLNNLAGLYDSLGQKPEALDYYQQALAIRREVGDRGGEGVTLNNLGRVYDSLGQKPEALDYYQQALAIYREVGDRGNEGVTLWNIGAFFFQQQDDVALASFLLAKHLFEDVQSPYQNDVQSWIDSLRDSVGEEQFALLVAQVEPRAQQVFEQFLHRKKG